MPNSDTTLPDIRYNFLKLLDLTREIGYLIRMIVAPFDSKLQGCTFSGVLNRPVMRQWHHTSREEVIEFRPNEQRHRVACQDVLLAHRPRPPFGINLVPVTRKQRKSTVGYSSLE